MPNRGFEAPLDEIVRGDRSRPTASWAFTWSPTARDVAYRARTRPPSYIHFAVFPHLIHGHSSATSWPCWAA